MSHWKLEITCEENKKDTVKIYEDMTFDIELGNPPRKPTVAEMAHFSAMVEHMNHLKIIHMECNKL